MCIRGHALDGLGLGGASGECAVVGLPNETWGEVVAVAAFRHDGADLETEEFADWSRKRLSHNKIPRRLLMLVSLPRNAMGEVTKRALIQMMADPGT